MELEDWTDGDKLTCIKCDRFVSILNENKMCPESLEEKRCYKCGTNNKLEFIKKGKIVECGNFVLIKNVYLCKECKKWFSI